uniref:Prokaryotic-type class I peptide chain release factors domain-containing protein n=1 Tax=Mycena chlorophos TaxID=658473 RepID=A0ABQ0KYR8_MYCCL|nr:predicted protein [Mycena chlorophos]
MISTEAQAAARAAYRQLFRAANATFAGDPPVLLAFRSKMRQDAVQNPPRKQPPAPALDNKSPRMSYSALKVAHRNRVLPELKKEDIEESFVRGSGPGGQSVNKTENNVQLLHRPTGLRVSCHETRSLATNRQLARRLLLEKLDQMHNPGLTKESLVQSKMQERKRQRRRKREKKKRAKEEEERSESS